MIDEKTIEILKEHAAKNREAFNDVKNGYIMLSSGFEKCKCYLAQLINNQNLSDDIDDEGINSLYSSLKAIKSYKRSVDSIIHQLQEFADNTRLLDETPTKNVTGSDTNNPTKMVYLKVTTESNCPICYKSEIVPMENTKTNFNIYDESGKYIRTGTIESMRCNRCNKFFITRDSYHSLKSRILLNNTNLKISFFRCIPKIIDYADFLVLSSIQRCSNENHYVRDILASIRVIYNNGDIVLERINASYCQECDRFIVLKEDYKKLNGIPMCRIIDETRTTPNDNHFEGFDYSESDTLFFQRGYNVNCIDNLPKAQRQRILEQILIHHEISKAEICSYIDTLISRGEKIPNWNNAVKRWKEDREFIAQLQLPNLEKVSVRSITMK